jgi:hypothetical protein
MARSNDLVTEAVGDETVVYDGLTSEAHCLSPLAATVFRAADGLTSPAVMAQIASRELDEEVEVETVELAISELYERNLLDEPAIGDGLSRRNMLRKSALVGGTVLAAPMVASLATPDYASAVSNPTSLSYVALMIVCGNTAYRMKIAGDGSVVCGTSFNTPGEGDCTLSAPGGTTISESCLAGVSISQNVATGKITITFPSSSGGSACKLTDYIVKCANVCQANSPAVPGGGASSPFIVDGCPTGP